MKLYAINRAIQEMCVEVTSVCEAKLDWRNLSEEQLLFEATVCMFSSQMVFEVAEAAAGRIFERGLLNSNLGAVNISDYEAELAAALSEPLYIVSSQGKGRHVKPRFKNRLASLLAATVQSIYSCGTTLRDKLTSAKSSRHAREILVNCVWGFGPKQASLYLRRIGYCSELAVLDTHVLDYLRLASGIVPKPSSLSRLTSYELLENEFQRIAREFGHSVGCVDLATWVTMRVAKRETILWV